MKVRATKLGYYEDKRRRPGEVFVLKPRQISYFNKKKGQLVHEEVSADQQFSKKWMEPVDGPAPEQSEPEKPKKKASKKKSVQEAETLAEAQKIAEPIPSDEEEGRASDFDII